MLTVVKLQSLPVYLEVYGPVSLAVVAGWHGLFGHGTVGYKFANRVPISKGLQAWLVGW